MSSLFIMSLTGQVSENRYETYFMEIRLFYKVITN